MNNCDLGPHASHNLPPPRTMANRRVRIHVDRISRAAPYPPRASVQITAAAPLAVSPNLLRILAELAGALNQAETNVLPPAPVPVQEDEATVPEVVPRTARGSDATPQSGITCPICLKPPKGAVVTMCGHIFCEACAATAFKVSTKCPVCRTEHGCGEGPPGVPTPPPPYMPLFF
jgi:hypothetical protein